jgi:hypothetical protein
MRRGEIVRLFKQSGGGAVGETLTIDFEDLFKFLAQFEEARALEVLNDLAERRRKRTKDNLNSEILDKRRGIDVKAGS